MAQTKKDIQAILAAAGINPLKRFGQNFLIDGNLLRKLVAAADITPQDAVLEVGPGTGTLTEELLSAAGAVVAVEIDNGLAAICRDRFGPGSIHDRSGHSSRAPSASDGTETEAADPLAGARGSVGGVGDHQSTQSPTPVPAFTLLHRDVLERSRVATEVLETLQERQRELGGRAMLVANLPYQVATPLLIELLMGSVKVSPLCFTVQAEVADRLAAPHGGKEYGPISIFAQAMASIERIARVPPASFWPVPGVDSAMLRLDVHETPLPPATRAELHRLVHGCFNHRRKTMRYNLRELLTGEQYQQIEADGRWNLNDRPEQLTVRQWVELAERTRTLTGSGE